MALRGLIFIALLLNAVTSSAQEHESESDRPSRAERHEDHGFHRNHFGGVVGVTTHHDSGESGLTLGLDYARQMTRHWAFAGYIELVSSDLERDLILAVGATYYPMRGLSLVVAPGIESAKRDVEVGGEVRIEDEFDFMLRFGISYVARLTDEAGLGPVLLVDWAGDRWTSVFGLAMVVGF